MRIGSGRMPSPSRRRQWPTSASATCAASKARWAEANEHYRQASAIRPDAPEIPIEWASCPGSTGAARRGDRPLQPSGQPPTRGAAPPTTTGATLSVAAGDLEGAIAHYREAVRLEPQGAEAYTNWGRALAMQGKREEAIAKYREALRIKPLSVPHYNWGNALFAAGDFDGAIAHYREAVRLDPDAAEAYNNWGMALARQAKWEEAIVRYREALGRRPNYPLASANLDRCAAGVREDADALRLPGQWWCRKGTEKMGMKPFTVSRRRGSPAPARTRTSGVTPRGSPPTSRRSRSGGGPRRSRSRDPVAVDVALLSSFLASFSMSFLSLFMRFSSSAYFASRAPRTSRARRPLRVDGSASCVSTRSLLARLGARG